MVTIDKIDFSKLKPYDGTVTKCFEQLCYQIAQKEYGHLGSFTAIDGSGGDSGVEFYLKLDNGEKWGWQCKFFGDNGRLNISSRDTGIENSLKTSLRNHNDLTKWFLCLKTDLTADSLSKIGKFSKGEKNWFENVLKKIIPTDRNIELEHWGESTFLAFLKDSKHFGIRSFFFGALELNSAWFKKKFEENSEKVHEKYDPELHTIGKYTQSIIDCALFDINYSKHIQELKKELIKKEKEISLEIEKFTNLKVYNEKILSQKEDFLGLLVDCKKHIKFYFESLNLLESYFLKYEPESIENFNTNEITDNFHSFTNTIKDNLFKIDPLLFKNADQINSLIFDFIDEYYHFFRNFFHEPKSELHILAKASKGKTHLSYDIAYNKIKNEKPAIFITADRFTNETNLSRAILDILDIPNEFTLDDFLRALDMYGSILKIKLPIIIDGLNETTVNCHFSPIWGNHLAGFICSICQYKNLCIITTCRTSYAGRIWGNNYKKSNKFHQINGFDNYETIFEVAEKYFKKYKIITDLSFTSLWQFREPIFLRIFCEIKNPNWKLSNNLVRVYLEESSTDDIFYKYIEHINKRVSNQYSFLRTGQPFIQSSLEKLAKYLWDNDTREIPIEVFYELIDGNVGYDKDTSKADILRNEGLILDSDNRNEHEFVIFTYQILSGYLIAKYLIKTNDSSYFISSEFENKVFNEASIHPLYDDILEAVSLLLPKIKNKKLHDLMSVPDPKGKAFKNRLFNASIVSLYKLSGSLINENDCNLISELFLLSNLKANFLKLFFRTLSNINHPLNALFLSKILASMQMNERDIYWSEYIRKESLDIENLINQFEAQCRSTETEPDILTQKQHILSRIVVWFLTSTNIRLRDFSTRALYYYGRKFPDEFVSLVYDSLNFNDPYVWERTLAALYGVAMAEHNSLNSNYFRDFILPNIGKRIYDLVFRKGAPHSTTHILTRDYARRTIEISLIYHPNLLNADEIKNIKPPYSYGGLRKLGEYDYDTMPIKHEDPIQMDFSNYTLGRIVKNGHSYSDPPEKRKVRRQIYWRIFNLGWNENLFKDVEYDLRLENYYGVSRSERPKVERYGKKYSWIAFYENAGLRDDLRLLKRDWPILRTSEADIDPSFPSSIKSAPFIVNDLLGDRTIPLVEWCKNENLTFIEEYLSIKNLYGNSGEWICLDAHISQRDSSAKRCQFLFIRSFLVKESDYMNFIELFKKQRLGSMLLPEKRENSYTYFGELYYNKESTYSNKATIGFEIERRKIKIKKGEDGYKPDISFNERWELIASEPEEIDTEAIEKKDFHILMPVMKYSFGSDQEHLNDVSHTTVLGKEIAHHLQLINQPQTFDLFDKEGNKSSINIDYHNDYNNNHQFVYLRKDLLDKFLSHKKYKLVWAIWGEKQIAADNDGDYFNNYSLDKPQRFQKIVEYK